MKSIGVRELRQRASEYLRQVEAVASVEIMARGRPVALLVPVRGTDHVEEMARRGRVIPPTGDVLDVGPPAAARSGQAPSGRGAGSRAGS